MLDRYSRNDMLDLWGDSGKFNSWLRMEIATQRAMAKAGLMQGHIPDLTEKYAVADEKRIKEIDALIDHDMNAFLRAVSESIRENMAADSFSEEEIDEVLSCLHAGLTSYDIEDTSLALRLKIATDYIMQDLRELCGALWDMALKYKDSPQIGRTHLQHAEPITFGLKLLTWFRAFNNHKKHIERDSIFWQTGKISGAVGTFTHLPPEVEESVVSSLGIYCASVSSQIVSREGIAYLLSGLSVIAGTISKCARDIEHMSSTEVREVFEGHPSGKQGSSAMPHKSLPEFSNPNKCERLVSLAKIVRAYAGVAAENIDIRHEQDLTQSASERFIIAGSLILVDYMVNLFTRIMNELVVDTVQMLRNIHLTGGLVFSQHVTKALMDGGMPREEARKLVTRLCRRAVPIDSMQRFEDVVKSSKGVRKFLNYYEIDACFDLDRHLRNVDKIFERFE